MHPMVNIATDVVRRASKIILRAVDHIDSISISEKSRNDYVTEIDKATEQEIISSLRKVYPDHRIIAEESGVLEGNEENTWIIDPLDGTSNFIHGFPHFAISLAFQSKAKIEHGVVYDPLRNELFSATRGEGARLNDKKIRVSSRKKLEDALIGTGFPFRQPQHFKTYLSIFETLFPQTADMRRAGSAALDLAYVAAGRLDGFFEIGLKPWDIAAGVLLIKEAGGLISDLDGKENYMNSGNIVSGNPKIFKGLIQAIQACLHD